MAAKLLKLELIYSCVGKKLMVRMLFLAIALVAVSGLYAVYDAAPCTYLSDCPDDFMVDFARPRWPLIRRNSLQSVPDQALPEIFEPKAASLGGVGIETYPQKIWPNKTWREKVEFYSEIFRDLVARGLLRSGLKALCVGVSSGDSVVALRENGLLDATAFDDRRSVAPKKADNWRFPFADNSFDFVFSVWFDRATVPALLASEIERTLKANGVAVLLVSLRRPNMGKSSNVMHSLSPVVALFKVSDVVRVTTSGFPKSQDTTVIALRKRPSGGSKPLGLVKGSPNPKQKISSSKLAEPLTNDSKPLGLIKDNPRSKQNRSSTKLAEPLTKSPKPLGLMKDYPRSKQNRSVIKLAETLTKGSKPLGLIKDHPRSKQNRSFD